jgi:hypothetical protein
LPQAQYTLKKHNISGTSNKANHTLILSFQLNQIKTYEKSEKSKQLF